MRTSAVGGLLIWAILSCMGQTSREPYTFFKEFIGEPATDYGLLRS